MRGFIRLMWKVWASPLDKDMKVKALKGLWREYWHGPSGRKRGTSRWNSIGTVSPAFIWDDTEEGQQFWDTVRDATERMGIYRENEIEPVSRFTMGKYPIDKIPTLCESAKKIVATGSCDYIGCGDCPASV